MRKFGIWTSVVGVWLAIGLSAANSQPTPSRVSPRNDLSTMAREPFQIFDNFYFVGQGEVASYVITTDEGHILIDTMWDLPGYLEYLLNNIRKVGLRPRDIRYVLILQGHRDHYRGAPALNDVLDVQWGANEADWELIERDLGDWTPPRDIVIEEGDTLSLGDLTIEFEITPGHTAGTTSMKFPVFDNGTRYNAYFHGGTALRLDDPDIIREFIADCERIKRMAGSEIDVQIVNHYDITPYGAPDLFERAELLQERQRGEPHPWVRPGEIVRLMDELIADARDRLARAEQN
ncbi:MAG: MBL fold metallo-hydrolase [Gammaproteobacteria bacterium]|nr:MBL fold metallo-hydrolase [Gammaproteobacteria bacterium]MDH3505686.1 MBL fold metallo-hydrolase [Gammaproteobacteria bacterium]